MSAHVVQFVPGYSMGKRPDIPPMVILFPAMRFNPVQSARQDAALAKFEAEGLMHMVRLAISNSDGEARIYFANLHAAAMVRWEKANARKWYAEHLGLV